MPLTKSTVGLWCEKDRVFYYLETNGRPHSRATSVLKRTLMGRDLIDYTTQKEIPSPDYLIMRWKDALDKGYEAKPIYLTKHIQKVVEAQDENKETSPWD